MAGRGNSNQGVLVTTPFPLATMRAPALYVAGFVDRESDGEVVPFTFRLPCPPLWEGRQPGAWAAERRARRAYFATLDAMRTGVVDQTESTKLDRLLKDLRSRGAASAVGHFRTVMDFVRRLGGEPVIPSPPAPLDAVVITAPPPAAGGVRPDELAERYRWALDWLTTRRFLVSKELRVEWRVRRVTPRRGTRAIPNPDRE